MLSVGGNDLDTAGGPGTLEVGRRMCDYAQALVGRGVMKVFMPVCEETEVATHHAGGAYC